MDMAIVEDKVPNIPHLHGSSHHTGDNLHNIVFSNDSDFGHILTTNVTSGNNSSITTATTTTTFIEPWCEDLQSNDLLYTATHHATPLRQIVAVVFLILLVFTVVGNAFVILVVVIDRRLRRITSGLIVSMAVADLLVALSMELHGVIMVFDQSNDHLSSLMCELSIAMDIYFALCELLHLTCLAVERYLAICHPFLYERCGKKFLILIIILAWTIPLCFSFLPILTMWSELRQGDIYHCMESLHIERCVFFPNQIFSSLLFFVMFVIPTILLLFCYTKILQVALTHRRRIDTQTTLGSYVDSHFDTINSEQPNTEVLPKSKSLNYIESSSSIDEYLNMSHFDMRNSTSDKERTAETNFQQPEVAPFIQGVAENIKSIDFAISQPPGAITSNGGTTSGDCNVKSTAKQVKSKSTKSKSTKSRSSSCRSGAMATAGRRRWHRLCGAIFGIDDFFRTSRSIVYVCISFVLTWTPYWTLILISPFIGPQSIPKAAILVAMSLFSLGTAINPFVYYFCNTDVRRGIFRVVKRLCFKYARCNEQNDF